LTLPDLPAILREERWWDMDWGSTLVGLGGLAVAGISLWFNYVARAAGHREAIYQRQIQAYSDLIRGIWDYYDELRMQLHSISSEPEAQVKAKIRECYLTAFHIYQRNLLFLPDRVAAAARGVFSLHLRSTQEWPPNADMWGVEMGRATLAVITEARTALGIEPLSQEILSLAGSKAKEKNTPWDP
jgi:hypothetical protein